MVEVKIKSCLPGKPEISDQYHKVREEETELFAAYAKSDNIEIIKESLDEAVASIGLAELVAEKFIEQEGLGCTKEDFLQALIHTKYAKKQHDFKEDDING